MPVIYSKQIVDRCQSDPQFSKPFRRIDTDFEIGIYILHFSHPIIGYKPLYLKAYGGPYHYVGKSNNIMRRVRRHLAGDGASKTIKALKHGVRFTDVTLINMPGTKSNESFISDHAEKFCDQCKAIPLHGVPEGQVVM